MHIRKDILDTPAFLERPEAISGPKAVLNTFNFY